MFHPLHCAFHLGSIFCDCLGTDSWGLKTQLECSWVSVSYRDQSTTSYCVHRGIGCVKALPPSIVDEFTHLQTVMTSWCENQLMTCLTCSPIHPPRRRRRRRTRRKWIKKVFGSVPKILGSFTWLDGLTAAPPWQMAGVESQIDNPSRLHSDFIHFGTLALWHFGTFTSFTSFTYFTSPTTSHHFDIANACVWCNQMCISAYINNCLTCLILFAFVFTGRIVAWQQFFRSF